MWQSPPSQANRAAAARRRPRRGREAHPGGLPQQPHGEAARRRGRGSGESVDPLPSLGAALRAQHSLRLGGPCIGGAAFSTQPPSHADAMAFCGRGRLEASARLVDQPDALRRRMHTRVCTHPQETGRSVSMHSPPCAGAISQQVIESGRPNEMMAKSATAPTASQPSGRSIRFQTHSKTSAAYASHTSIKSTPILVAEETMEEHQVDQAPKVSIRCRRCNS